MDRDGDRAAGVLDRRAADQAVGGLQGDGADHAVADVLGDLEEDVLLLAVEFDIGGQQVVLLGHRVGRELDVDDRTDDAGDPADATLGGSGRSAFGNSGSHESFLCG